MNIYLALGIGALAAFAVTFALGFVLIPFLRRLKFGQTIYADGPAWHISKQGTPTMGGFLFIAGFGLSAAAVFIADAATGSGLLSSGSADDRFMAKKLIAGLCMACAYALVGFIDDYIKVVKKRNLGLTIKQKSILEIVVIIAYLTSLHLSGAGFIFVPFVGNVSVGLWFWPIGAACVYCTVNAVNFTDGIDGLCSSVTLVAAVGFGAAAMARGFFGASIFSACLVGAMAGYLVWNSHPAKVFMGDTGALFLGGLVVAVAYMLDSPWLVLCVGIVYVLEFLSDIIQIVYFKATHGKRLFKMAPIHHHFEKCGWSENKICIVFCAVGVVGAAVGVLLTVFGKPV